MFVNASNGKAELPLIANSARTGRPPKELVMNKLHEHVILLIVALLIVFLNTTLVYAAFAPDFSPDAEYLYNSLYIDTINATRDTCLAKEGCVSGMGLRKVIRFGSMIWNIGTADASLGAVPDWIPNDACSDSDVETRQGPFYFDRCHKHWHFEGYARYRLYKVIDMTKLPFTQPLELLRSRHTFANNLDIVSIGHKRGFCLEDSICPPSTKPKFTCAMQGVSVGCADLYWDQLPCQWIDVTGHESSSQLYVLENWVNYDETLEELNYANNRVLVPFYWSALPERATDEWTIPPSGFVCPS